MRVLLPTVVPLVLLLGSYVKPAIALRVTQALLLAWGGLSFVDATLSLTHAQAKRPYLTTPATKRLALVTGASSRLGREITTLLAQQGYALLLVARREPLLQDLQRELQQLTTQDVLCVVADLGSPEGVQSVIDHVRNQRLEVDVLINNAGASVRGELTSLPAKLVDSLVELNVAAATKLTHALVPGMVARRRGGKVLMISSLASVLANPFAAIYSSSKAYLIKFALATNYELRGTGVTVTAFLPGPLHTEFGQHAQCQSAIYMNLPGRATPREAAIGAIAAMDNEMTLRTFDNWTTRMMATTLGYVLPLTLSTTLVALTMEDPTTLLTKIRGKK